MCIRDRAIDGRAALGLIRSDELGIRNEEEEAHAKDAKEAKSAKKKLCFAFFAPLASFA